MTTMMVVMMNEDNSNLVPMQPETEDPALPEEPTPQDYGFPEKPNAAQVDCWRRQEAFLDAYRRHGIYNVLRAPPRAKSFISYRATASPRSHGGARARPAAAAAWPGPAW